MELESQRLELLMKLASQVNSHRHNDNTSTQHIYHIYYTSHLTYLYHMHYTSHIIHNTYGLQLLGQAHSL